MNYIRVENKIRIRSLSLNCTVDLSKCKVKRFENVEEYLDEVKNLKIQISVDDIPIEENFVLADKIQAFEFKP